MTESSCTHPGARQVVYAKNFHSGSLRCYRGFLLLIVSGLIFNLTISDAHGQNVNPELLTYDELVQRYTNSLFRPSHSSES